MNFASIIVTLFIILHNLKKIGESSIYETRHICIILNDDTDAGKEKLMFKRLEKKREMK